jgi:hypothetical protein
LHAQGCSQTLPQSLIEQRHEKPPGAGEEGRLNYNACAEGFNVAIQLIKANVRGFPSVTNYRARILFHCGKLNLAAA